MSINLGPESSNKTLNRNKVNAGYPGGHTLPEICTVMSNTAGNGIIYVYPSTSFELAPKSENSWTQAKRLNSFFSSTSSVGPSDGLGDYLSTPHSYGQWNSPPEVGTQVMVIYGNGDSGQAFYLGSVAEPNLLQMVPAIGSKENITVNEGEASAYGGATTLPTTNINTSNKKLTNANASPVHSYVGQTMNTQGVIRDPIRGPITTSASRESPSRVGWGVSTPGRAIYQAGGGDVLTTLDSTLAEQKIIGRQGGHSIVMDDGDAVGNDQLIRIRTSAGHQISMSDNGQLLSILHSNGQSFIELGPEGTIDVFATNSINLRSKGDLNFHADQDVNIHASKKLNMYAVEGLKIESGKSLTARATEDIELYAVKNLLGFGLSATSFASGGDASLQAEGKAFVKGKKVMLNSGIASTQPTGVTAIKLQPHSDTAYSSEKGFACAPASLLSICSRTPAHLGGWESWDKGVTLRDAPKLGDELPADPPAGVQNLINESAGSSGPGIAVSTMASIPDNEEISSSLSKDITSSLISNKVTATSTTPVLKDAVSKGTSIVTDTLTQTKSVIVGSAGLTPEQLVSGGVIKPGTDTLVNTLINSGKDVTKSMPSSMFTGSGGASSLTAVMSSSSIQASTVVSGMKKAQSALTVAGAISGKESAGAIAGMVNAVASDPAGIATSATNTLSALKGGTPSLDTLKGIGSGTLSASIALGAGPLAGLASSLGELAKTPSFSDIKSLTAGLAKSGFNAILQSYVPFSPGISQNLVEIAKKNIK